MNEETAIEFTKIHILVIAGIATSLQIGLIPNPYYFGVAIVLLMQTTTFSLLSLINTNEKYHRYIRNMMVYIMITSFLLLIWGFVAGELLGPPQTKANFLTMLLSPFLISVFIVLHRYAVYREPDADDGFDQTIPVSRMTNNDLNEISLYVLNLAFACSFVAWFLGI